MADFTKIYYHPKNEMESLSLLWDSGYRNVQIYHKDRLVKSYTSPGVFMNGVKFTDDELGTIRVKFTTTRPRKLEIRVNKKKYVTINKLEAGYNFGGLIAVFTGLAVFTAIGLLLFLGATGFYLEHPVVQTVLVIDIVIIAIYGVTSYLLSKRKSWAYFMGTGLFAFTTLYAVLGKPLFLTDWVSYIILIPRLAILAYALSQVKNVLDEIKRVQENQGRAQLLDD